MGPGNSSLKKTLDAFYREYNFRERLSHDPISFPRRYSAPEDIEVAGLIASSFAYGRIDLFRPVVENILKPGGRRPARFFREFSLKRDSRYFKDMTYRFNTGKDILCFVYILSRILKKWGSLKRLFYHGFSSHHEDTAAGLDCFTGAFLAVDTTPAYKKNIKPRGLSQLLPRPAGGSACKRLNLFLRWMVRTNDIDLGVWSEVLPSQLIIPLDTHILKIARCLGLTRRTASDWKTAKEVTESLKEFDPDDPLKYDFALCHHGISGMCKGERSVEVCQSCSLTEKESASPSC